MTAADTISFTLPAVSVIIPLYQTERYIGAAIQSVLAQTFADFELLIVDDGSIDKGPTIARGFDDSRIRVIPQENRGLAGARNTGIREARTAMIAFLDADDLWHPEKLASHIAHLRACPDVGVSFSHSRLIDEHGKVFGSLQFPEGRVINAPELFCRNPVGNGSTPVVRRSALDAIAFHDAARERTCWFDESFRQSEDIECWMRIAATTPWLFAAVSKPLTDYRITDSGLSANVEKQLATWRRFRAKVRDYAPDIELAHGRRAEAYQLRYLARRAVKSADRTLAAKLIHQALWLHPVMVREEPRQTVVTLLAAHGVRLLPRGLYETCAHSVTGLMSLKPRLRV